MRLRILELPTQHAGEISETPFALIFDRCNPNDGGLNAEQITSGQMRETTGAAFVLAFSESIELGEYDVLPIAEQPATIVRSR